MSSKLNKLVTMTQTKPPYYTLTQLINMMPAPNNTACQALYKEHEDLFKQSLGAKHNHQAWPGGYLDHVTDAMNTSLVLFDALNAARPLPFQRADALVVLFLHDLEKPFKYSLNKNGIVIKNSEFTSRDDDTTKKQELIDKFGIRLNKQQVNALRYVEGVRDNESSPEARIMGELATLCHCADSISALLWYNYPLGDDEDPWSGAARANKAAKSFVVQSEL